MLDTQNETETLNIFRVTYVICLPRWFEMNQRFVSNILKCNKLLTTTDDNTNSNNDDNGIQVMTITHITFGSGELQIPITII